MLILVLMMAAALAASIGKVTDAAVIMVVVLLNAALGFYQEFCAEQSLAALKKMLPSRARVKRDGSTHEIPAGRRLAILIRPLPARTGGRAEGLQDSNSIYPINGESRVIIPLRALTSQT